MGFWNRSYTETTRKIRQIGEYCIRKRLTALENNEEVSHDILTLILQTVRESPSIVSAARSLIVSAARSLTCRDDLDSKWRLLLAENELSRVSLLSRISIGN